MSQLTAKRFGMIMPVILMMISITLVGCSQVASGATIELNPEDSNNQIDQEQSQLVDEAVDTSQAEIASQEDDISEDPSNDLHEDEVETIFPASPVPLPDNDTQLDHQPADGQIMRETRAIWTWAGRKRVPGRKTITRLDIDELVAKVDAANLNVIMISVYHKGTAYFEPSHTSV